MSTNAPSSAAAATPASAVGVGPTRKTLFGKSGDGEVLATPEVLDSDEQVSQADKALVEEMLCSLRDASKEMERDNWLYETQDPQVAMSIKV